MRLGSGNQSRVVNKCAGSLYMAEGSNLDPVLRPKEVAAMLGVSVTTLWRMEEEDEDFPPRVQLTERRCGWRLSSLDEYIDKKTVAQNTLQ